MSGINKICSNLTLAHNIVEVSRKVHCFSVAINISKNLAVFLKDIKLKFLVIAGSVTFVVRIGFRLRGLFLKYSRAYLNCLLKSVLSILFIIAEKRASDLKSELSFLEKEGISSKIYSRKSIFQSHIADILSSILPVNLELFVQVHLWPATGFKSSKETLTKTRCTKVSRGTTSTAVPDSVGRIASTRTRPINQPSR